MPVGYVQERRRILDECSRQAHDVVTANRQQLEMLVAELLEKETLHAGDLYRVTGLPAPGAPAIP